MKQGLWTLLLVSSVISAQGIDLAALLAILLALIVRRSTSGDLHAVEAKLMRAHTANNASLIRPTKLSGLRTLSSTRQGQLQLFSINSNTIF